MGGRTIPSIWQHDPALNAPARYRRACRYEAFVPDRLAQLDFTLDAALAGLIAESESAIQSLNDSARPALMPLARLLLRSEAIASSKIEGMQMGTRELARAEARMDEGGRVSSTATEVMANIAAMEFAIHEAAEVESFGIPQIQSIHRQLMEPCHPRIAGRLRTGQNWIGGNDYNPCGADFVPPPPDEVVPLLEDLCKAIEDNRLSPLVQAALVHAQFETIHPFDDGNGRTGRALVHVVLRRRGIAHEYVPPISVILSRKRDRYIAGLTRYRGDAIGEWIEHFAGAAGSAARLAADYLNEVRALVDRWRSRLTESASRPREGAAAWALIDELPAHPLITAPLAGAVVGRTHPAVYQAIRQLEDAGILVPLSDSRRNRTWEAVGLLDLLAGLDEGEALIHQDTATEEA